jgi:hypothetical protein
MERILLSPSRWWIEKIEGHLMVSMFARRAANGDLNLEWEVLDESNLPVDLIRRDGSEYSFILPVGCDGHAAVDKVGAGVGREMLAALERIISKFDEGKRVEGHCICDARAAIELAHGNFSYASADVGTRASARCRPMPCLKPPDPSDLSTPK